MVEINIQVQGEALQTVHNIQSSIIPETTKKMQKWVLKVSAQAKRNAPVDRGTFRNSITEAVYEQAHEVTGIVGSNLKEFPFIEYGTGQIGKRTALAQGVTAPVGYNYGPQEGHFVPFSKAPDLIRWLNKHGFDVQPSGLGRYDIMLRGSGTILFGNAKGFKVSGRAQPSITPAFLKYKDEIARDFDALPGEIIEKNIK